MNKFNDIYVKVLKESGEELEQLRKIQINRTIKTSIVVSIIIIMLLAVAIRFAELVPEMLMITVLGIIAITLRIFVFKSKISFYKKGSQGDFNSEYKQKIIKTFIKAYDENLDYDPNLGISPSEYIKGQFDDGFDRFCSEDLIKGNIGETKIKISEVQTEIIREDEDGNKSYSVLFHGMFGIIELEQFVPSKIFIRENRSKAHGITIDCEKVELDSLEFEKRFDVYTNDKIQAMRILTADVMTEMLEYYNENKNVYEITIIGNMLYIRFKSGSMFEGNIFKSAVDFDALKKNYDIINSMFNISKKITDIINKKDF